MGFITRTITVKGQVNKMKHTEAICVRLPDTWLLALKETAGVLKESLGYRVSVPDVVRLIIMDKFGFNPKDYSDKLISNHSSKIKSENSELEI